MEDYNFNENAITMPDLLKIEEDTGDLVVAFIDKKYMDDAKAVFQLSEDLCNYLKSGEKDRDFHIEPVTLGVWSRGVEVIEEVSANVRFNVGSGKYELYVRIRDTDLATEKFIKKGKVFNNLEDIV